ncbi:MAG: prepilin-type N-terminal cleavage/methylation domain-containing protein [Thermodesulfobacteriota bacterium]|nr:prepilin-type N-terminal cleavage/methylation domain-containing protein [Thermodesulfobacteriota bacterium]
MLNWSRKLRMTAMDDEGFSLIEAMVAMSIFVVGVLGCYKMQLHATKSNALANRVSTSANWATYQIEELLGKDYDDPAFTDYANGDDGDGGSYGVDGLGDLEANADGVIYVLNDGFKQNASSASEIYSVSWNIAEGTAAETSVLRDVKQIRVHVVRKGGIGTLANGAPLYSHDYFITEEF